MMFISVTLSGKKLLLAQLATLVFLLALPIVSSLNVGDELCIQGFIMDYFCIQNVKMIDNGRVTLEEPERHTVHCLVDVGICLDSAFEVLVESSSGSTPYSRGYRLDDASKSDMIDLARSVGSCTTCANGYDGSGLTRGFKAVMKVNVLDLNPNNGQNAPPLVRVNERKDSSNLGNDPCQSEYGMKEGIPVADPTNRPTAKPTPAPTPNPTPRLSTVNPTPNPTPGPTSNPTDNDPTRPPTRNPTLEPEPARVPTPLPIRGPTAAPSDAPSLRPSASDVTGSPTAEVVIASPTVTPKTTAAPSTMPPTITTGGGNSTTPDPTDSSVVIGLFWSTIIGIACAIAAL